MKKKTIETSDPHTREAHIAESFEKHSEPTTAPLTPTGIPMQVIAPIPVPTPTPISKPSAPMKMELIEIEGIDEKTAAQLRKLGINDAKDLAKTSAEDLAKNLGLPPKNTQKWVKKARDLQK